jgi:GNAT superfamily N-acetyltransferase
MNTNYRIVRVDEKNIHKLRIAIQNMNLETNAHRAGNIVAGCSGAKYKLDKVVGGYLVYFKGNIVGWGAYFKDSLEAHIFTHRIHRRQGVGTRLVERFSKDHPTLKFCPWHRRVQGFFNKRGVEYVGYYLY